MKRLSITPTAIFLLLLVACSPAAAPAPTAAPVAATSTSTPAPLPAPTIVQPTQAPPTPTPVAAIGPTPIAIRCPPCLAAYTMPDAGVQFVSRAVDNAQRTIKLTMYLFTEPTLVDALRRAALRNVEVRVLMERNPFGGGNSNDNAYNALKDAGVKWQWTDDNVYTYTHQKSMVIDDRLAYIMSNNFTTSSFTSNREYGVVDADPADVAEIIRVFEADWTNTRPDLADARLVWSPVNARARIEALIDQAKTSLDLEQEEMQDAEIGSHLLAALKRGVKMRVVASPTDPLGQDINEKQRDDLRRAGAAVGYLYAPYVHAKLYIVDARRAFVGSENNSTNSLDHNRELGIIVDDTDAITVFSTAFEKDFAAATKDNGAVSAATPAPNHAVNARDAANYYNQTVTVEGQVVSTYNSRRVIWLIMGPNQKTDFKVVIFPEDWSKFPQQPDKLYQGKTLRATGRVQPYLNAPEMIVRDPGSIVVVR